MERPSLTCLNCSTGTRLRMSTQGDHRNFRRRAIELADGFKGEPRCVASSMGSSLADGIPRQQSRSARTVAFIKNACGCTLRILELARFQRPTEDGKPCKREADNAEKHEDEHIHDRPAYLERDGAAIRKAFRVTTAEDADMAIAAINGVTHPANATGMTTIL